MLRLKLEGLESFGEKPMASLNDRAGAQRSMQPASRLSPLQRAYLMGFRRARILARRDVNAFAHQFEALNDEVYTDLLGARREMARLRAIDHAVEAERDDTLRLNESDQGWRPVASSTDLKTAALVIASSTLSLISGLTRKLRTWRQRERERAELARMSQDELHDIGVSSSEHWAEISKPFWRK
jgi:uncharacterized protein YjiS (DUF1127 family)